METNKKIIIGILALLLVAGFIFIRDIKTQTSFCDSAPLEYGSNFPPTCYEAPQSWKEEGKVYVGQELEVKN